MSDVDSEFKENKLRKVSSCLRDVLLHVLGSNTGISVKICTPLCVGQTAGMCFYKLFSSASHLLKLKFPDLTVGPIP